MSSPQRPLTAMEHRRRLRAGLVGSRETLYRQSPSFRAQIDALAHLLEPMIDGLATAAAQADEYVLHRAALAETTPLTLTNDTLRMMGLDPDKLARAARDSGSPARGDQPRENLDRAARDSDQSGGAPEPRDTHERP